MVLCLVTLTDPQTRRVGLSASAELLVLIFVNLWPILALCVADMVHAVADIVCGRYRRIIVSQMII